MFSVFLELFGTHFYVKFRSVFKLYLCVFLSVLVYFIYYPLFLLSIAAEIRVYCTLCKHCFLEKCYTNKGIIIIIIFITY